MTQFIKFICIGAFNTAIDIAVLNLLVALFGTGINGELFVFFKSVSFLTAVVNSYFFNKYWTFQNTFNAGVKEPILFFVVSIVGFAINVGVSYAVFLISTNWYSLPSPIAVNFGAITGTAVVFLWNFSGYKYLVFKTYHPHE